jgi:hypothetical protein
MTIQLSDLMPGAMNCIQNVAKIKPGEEVLLITDTTADKDVTEAYKIAGGLGGAEGAIIFIIKGEDEQVKKAIDYAEQSKGARLPQLRLYNCHDCPNPMCRFPVGDKHWDTT